VYLILVRLLLHSLYPSSCYGVYAFYIQNLVLPRKRVVLCCSIVRRRRSEYVCTYAIYRVYVIKSTPLHCLFIVLIVTHAGSPLLLLERGRFSRLR
jgi:hypothetical protein